MTDRSPATDTRVRVWMAVATAIHGAALIGLLLLPTRRGHDLTHQGSAVAAEIEVTLDGQPLATLEAPRPRAPNEPSEPSPHDQPTAGTMERVPARPPTASASSATAGVSSSVGGVSSSEPSGAPTGAEGAPRSPTGTPGTGDGVVPIPLTASQLGIGRDNPFLPRAEEKVPTSGPNTPAARAMRGTGLVRDRELGLGPEGPAVRALADATSSSIAPLRGRAVFLVRTGGDGLVSAIDVVDSEGGSGWLDAGRIALEALRGKKLNVPRGAAGLSMRIEVRSDMKLPSGENAPVTGRRGNSNMPELTIPDVSDLGSKPRRVVHSRVVSTELL